MMSQIKEAEPAIHEAQYQELIDKIQRWPEWKIQSFCLDQTDLRLLREIKIDILEARQKNRI